MDMNSLAHTKWECKPAKLCQVKNKVYFLKKGALNKGIINNTKFILSMPLLL